MVGEGREKALVIYFYIARKIWDLEIRMNRGEICAIVRAQRFPSKGTIVG